MSSLISYVCSPEPEPESNKDTKSSQNYLPVGCHFVVLAGEEAQNSSPSKTIHWSFAFSGR
ncbi:unnamed protein product [Arabidopsis thaliana]|uniref:Uncharacterized protein n=3 Tax=Arabidopsis TaxID=3701 RepID=A0A5S9XCZ9_ARATH|nr:hypothetical protein ISN45_At03g016050 [Arabidopsis thaliana x Arabidopsis arenosa]KAG7631374.1 hypothetical protein ISN44_As03g016080 [Arabidopsis suecica]CAA0382545.1 unnamed protein product [Arabidopsis thaliana]VYS57489.1 unnamed protein product [Arabidopsis thaliana]